jgi:hypothetical protein
MFPIGFSTCPIKGPFDCSCGFSEGRTGTYAWLTRSVATSRARKYGHHAVNPNLIRRAYPRCRDGELFPGGMTMFKYLFTTALLIAPVMASAIPARPGHHPGGGLFTAAELNNLAGLDESAPPARLRRMETEIAVLRDQVGRMKLERLIDTVLVDGRPAPRNTNR